MSKETRRETVVYHRVHEETPLINTKCTQSTFYNTTDQTPKPTYQKTIYSAITLADIFQKVVYTTIITSLLLFILTYLDLKYELALVVYFVFAICSWLSTAVLNLFTDRISRPRITVVFGFSIFFVGTGLLSGLSHHVIINEQNSLFKYLCIVPFYLICLGESICKTFIGDISQVQFIRLTDRLRPYTTQIYWIGHICAMLLIIFVLGIMEFGSYSFAMGLCCVSLCAGFLSFCVGWNRFHLPDATNGHNVFRLFYEIRKNAKENMRLESSSTSSRTRDSVAHWLDYARLSNGGNFSDQEVIEAKSCIRILYLFTALLPYWVCNAQAYSTFIYQGFHLKRTVGNYFVPVPWIALTSVMTMLCIAKLTDRILIPTFRKRRIDFSSRRRIIFGMISAVVAMALAGGVQVYAYYTFHSGKNTTSVLAGKINVTEVSEIHVLWIVPQYIFHGISEFFVGITGLGIAYKLCPSVFKKLVVSYYYVIVATGNVISMATVMIGNWFPKEDFFQGFQMIIYFFSLSGLALLGLFLYLCVDSRLDHSVTSGSVYHRVQETIETVTTSSNVDLTNGQAVNEENSV